MCKFNLSKASKNLFAQINFFVERMGNRVSSRVFMRQVEFHFKAGLVQHIICKSLIHYYARYALHFYTKRFIKSIPSHSIHLKYIDNFLVQIMLRYL